MKVVLLAGGIGSRIAEESEYKPKPMIEVGGMPILWHIMKSYSYYGFNDFIICAGYKQVMIKKWFVDYYLFSSDITIDMNNGNKLTIHNSNVEPWTVTVVDTGIDTMTGGRIKRISNYVKNETFMVTYGDGVCDVNLASLLEFHRAHGKIATLTAVVQDQTKGILDIEYDNSVRAFREKNRRDSAMINAGYMVFEPKVFDYIGGDESVLEKDVLSTLASEHQLMSYKHKGYWQCMDNLAEKKLIERLIEKNKAPWMKWL